MWSRNGIQRNLRIPRKDQTESKSHQNCSRGELIDSFQLQPQTRGNARNTPEKTNTVVPLLAGITILTNVNFCLARQIILWNFVSRSTTSFPCPCWKGKPLNSTSLSQEPKSMPAVHFNSFFWQISDPSFPELWTYIWDCSPVVWQISWKKVIVQETFTLTYRSQKTKSMCISIHTFKKDPISFLELRTQIS